MDWIIDYISDRANRDRIINALGVFVIVGGLIMNAIFIVAIIMK